MNPLNSIAVTLAQVNVNPSSGELPGGAQLQNIINGASWWATMFCLLAAVLAGGAMALSRYFQNSHYEQKSKVAALGAAGGAVLVAAAPKIINWATTLGRSVS